MAAKRAGQNFVSEWYGHRVYPRVSDLPQAALDQSTCRCPFLSQATNETRECVKAAAAKGVCTISTASSQTTRQDWMVCPYRAIDDGLLLSATVRIFGLAPSSVVHLHAATTLKDDETKLRLAQQTAAGERCFVYLQDKLGGEITLPSTDASPEMSFDVTIVELTSTNGRPAVGRYGIFEVQTMDFHGSYKSVVSNLEQAQRLHSADFHKMLGARQDWLSEKIEGPNLSNVFKRTFYQAMFKFRIAGHASCAGAVLALPSSVWGSWKRHLGGAPLDPQPDGTYAMGPVYAGTRTWIYVFDIEAGTEVSPSPISISKVITTDADSLAHFAFTMAPGAALAAGGSADRVLDMIRVRLAMRARWSNIARLARALGVRVPRGHGWRRRYVTVRRIVTVLYGPGVERP